MDDNLIYNIHDEIFTINIINNLDMYDILTELNDQHVFSDSDDDGDDDGDNNDDNNNNNNTNTNNCDGNNINNDNSDNDNIIFCQDTNVNFKLNFKTLKNAIFNTNTFEANDLIKNLKLSHFTNYGSRYHTPKIYSCIKCVKHNCQNLCNIRYCIHEIRKQYCKLCSGKRICEHNSRIEICKKCKGSQVCPHMSYKYYCNKCNSNQPHRKKYKLKKNKNKNELNE